MKDTILIFIFCLGAFISYGQTTVELPAAKDNTLYEIADGSISNGAGDYLFAGNTDQANNVNTRRALLQFDLSGIPSTAVINSVSLELQLTRSNSATPRMMSIHQVNDDWGEGTSNAAGQEGAGAAATTGDATWTHQFFNTDLWTTPGGDFNVAPSATTMVSTLGKYTWSATQMIIDVTNWVNGSVTNNGWIVIGDESTTETAYQISSRENASNPPKLIISYTDNSGCVTSLTVSGDIGSGTYEASNDVNIAGTVLSTATAIFRAATSVNMNVNSEIEMGADVELQIGDCSN